MEKVTRLFFCCMCISFLFTGCSVIQKDYAVQSGKVAIESTALRSQYNQMETMLRDIQNEKQVFDPYEWEILLEVDASLDMLILQFDAITHMNVSSISLETITYMHNTAVSSYMDARFVVISKWSEIPTDTQNILQEFDEQASETSYRVQGLLQDPDNIDTNEVISSITEVVSVAVKVLTALAVL